MTLTNEYQTVKSYQYTHSSGAKVTFKLEAKIGTSDIVNNKTPIYTKLSSILDVGSISGSGYKFTCSYAPTVEGNGIWYFATETITETNSVQYVEHDDDGTKDVTLTATIYNNYHGINLTLSDEVTLPTIARKSKVSCASPFNIEDNVTLNITSKNDNFTHTIRYSFENSTPTVIATGLKTTNSLCQYNWKTPTSMYTTGNMKNKQSGTGYLTVETFSDNVSLGVSDKFNFTANVTNSKPVVTAFTIEENDTNIKNNFTNGTSLIKGISSAKVTVNFSLKNGATFKEAYVTCSDGQKKIITESNKTVTFNNVKGNKFTFSIKDSREFETLQDKTYPMLEYFNPYAASVNINRTEQTSTEIKANISGKWWNGNFGLKTNTLKYSYRTRESGGTWSEWSTDTSLSSTNNNFSISNLSLGTSYVTTKAYDIQFRLKDEIGYNNLNIENVTESIGIVDFYEDMIDFQVPTYYKNTKIIYD